MTGVATNAEVRERVRHAVELQQAERPAEAVAEAWRAWDSDPEDCAARWTLAVLLREHPAASDPARRDDLHRLLVDPEVDPFDVAPAGWQLLLDAGLFDEPDPRRLANRLESDTFALRLLDQALVARLEVETALGRLRRWLLLSGAATEFPGLLAALTAQAAINGGAWPFNEAERARLDADPESEIAATYRPRPPRRGPAPAYPDDVTRRVAAQYWQWPYPVWTRITRPPPRKLPRVVEEMDGGRPSGLPVAAAILIAGCGTGREAALTARRYPDAHVTAIDISDSSLAYAADRAAGLGIEFRQLDLHRVAELGRQFDLIHSSGVLHHIADPEGGWAELVKVLRPGGVMRIALYSRFARLAVRAARHTVAELAELPVDEDVLREVRRRLIAEAPHLLGTSTDFYTIGGTRDLVLHPHEDPFDIPRIRRALDRFGLELLAWASPNPAASALYRRACPDDPKLRDLAVWATLEKSSPFMFARMYEFWCRRPA